MVGDWMIVWMNPGLFSSRTLREAHARQRGGWIISLVIYKLDYEWCRFSSLSLLTQQWKGKSPFICKLTSELEKRALKMSPFACPSLGLCTNMDELLQAIRYVYPKPTPNAKPTPVLPKVCMWYIRLVLRSVVVLGTHTLSRFSTLEVKVGYVFRADLH